MKNILNYFFTLLLTSYTFLLIFRIFQEREPREKLQFLWVYFVFTSFIIVAPLILAAILSFFLWIKSFFLKKSTKESFFKKFTQNLKNFLEKIRERLIHDFFYGFLMKNPKIKILCLKMVLILVKVITRPRLILGVLIIFPWLCLLITLSYEVFFKDNIIIFLYIAAVTALFRFLFRLILEVTIKISLSICSIEVFLYFPKIRENSELYTLFLNNHLVKEVMLDFVDEIPENKEFHTFLKNFIVKSHFYYCLRLQLTNLLADFNQLFKFLRKLNVIIFGVFLLPYFIEKKITLVVIIFLAAFLAFVLVLNYVYSSEDFTYQYNRRFCLAYQFWIESKTQFATFFPYQEQRTATQIVQEGLELQNLIGVTEKGFTGYSQFQEFSAYALKTKKIVVLVESLEDFIVDWFEYLKKYDLIDPLTCKIDFNKTTKEHDEKNR